MANSYIDIEEKYDLKSQNDMITVSVTIGNAQSGAYSIFLGPELISQNKPADLGSAEFVKAKKMILSCVVQDTRTETNWTSMKVELIEGSRDKINFGPYSKEVNKDLDTVTYTFKLTFL